MRAFFSRGAHFRRSDECTGEPALVHEQSMGARRILVSSSGTHSVRSDRVAPDSLRIFRGLYFTIPRRELATRFTEILLYSHRCFQTLFFLIGHMPTRTVAGA
jgi:hypothetical protein